MNPLGISLGVVLNFILARIWYGLIFKESWRQLTGRTPEENPSKKQMAVALVFAILMSFGTNILVAVLGIISDSQAIYTGFTFGIFFILPIIIGEWIWDKKPLSLVVVNTGFYIVYFISTLYGFVVTAGL